MLRKMFYCVIFLWGVLFFGKPCLAAAGGSGGGYGANHLSPTMVIVHKAPFSAEFGNALDSLKKHYEIMVHDVDYSEYFALSEEDRLLYDAMQKDPSFARETDRFDWLSGTSLLWEYYREYLLDSDVVLIFQNKRGRDIGIRIGELTEEEIVDFFKQRENPLELKEARQ